MGSEKQKTRRKMPRILESPVPDDLVKRFVGAVLWGSMVETGLGFRGVLRACSCDVHTSLKTCGKPSCFDGGRRDFGT